jgi:hypothetical protein
MLALKPVSSAHCYVELSASGYGEEWQVTRSSLGLASYPA